MTIQELAFANDVDADGNPAGGFVQAVGLRIDWQDGPLGRGPDRLAPNGAFVQTVLQACVHRLEHYNDTRFRCRENSLAITHVQEAIHWLQHRTADRETRGVEGTHEQ
jgi:hypothetical protein